MDAGVGGLHLRLVGEVGLQGEGADGVRATVDADDDPAFLGKPPRDGFAQGAEGAGHHADAILQS